MSATYSIRDLFLAGVYNETHNVLEDGGPLCASESSFGFKYVLNMLLVLNMIHIYNYFIVTLPLACNL